MDGTKWLTAVCLTLVTLMEYVSSQNGGYYSMYFTIKIVVFNLEIICILVPELTTVGLKDY